MKDLDDLDLQDEDPPEHPHREGRRRVHDERESAAEGEAEPFELGDPAEHETDWDEAGPSRLEDDGPGLPDLPPDVTPDKPLIPPLTWLLLLLVAVPVVLYVLLRPSAPETVEAPEVHTAPAELPASPGPEADATTDTAPALDLPPLGESDAAVRELLADLSASPGVATWLAQDQLVRTFVVAVENVADGESPAPHLGFLTPTGRFEVRQTGRGPVVATESFARYDAATGVLTSLDAGLVARRLNDLEPLTEAAYRELGHPQGGFGETLRRAIDRLLATPVPDAGAALERRSATWAWADPRLEALEPAQKHLLRTGPRNQAAIQAWLRSLGAALDAAGPVGPPDGGPTGGPTGAEPPAPDQSGAQEKPALT